MTREEAVQICKEIRHRLWILDEQTPIWDKGAVSEAILMAIEALKGAEINCVHCPRYFETEDETGVHSHCEDLISRAEAAEIFEAMLKTVTDQKIKIGISRLWQQIKDLPSADRPRGEWVKKTFGYGECPDCIDRQELIGSIQYLFDGLADSWVEASEKIIEIIREEPTVPQKEYTEQQIRDTFNSGYSCGMQNEWITDEPPVDGQEVIASVYWTDYGDTILAYGHYNARFDKWRLYSDVEGELNKGFEVIAWMPLPEPYKESDTK